MVAVSRYLKHLDPDCVTVFIGPCIAKKGETMNELIADRADYALTYGEIVALLESKGITVEQSEEDYQEASLFGKRFAGSGGVAKAVMEVMEEMDEDTSSIRLMACAGGDECKKAMMLLNAGKPLRMDESWPVMLLNVFVWPGIVIIVIAMVLDGLKEDARKTEIVMRGVAWILMIVQAVNLTLLWTSDEGIDYVHTAHRPVEEVQERTVGFGELMDTALERGMPYTAKDLFAGPGE